VASNPVKSVCETNLALFYTYTVTPSDGTTHDVIIDTQIDGPAQHSITFDIGRLAVTIE
jgi:hypothetical protein